ncbi:MAG TPA: PA14 domain-containing protein [Verrucomicrobiae bacterium]|nr:PA14 domain-containing protein [Verrucomicrobiae bacterium]
MTPVAVTGWNRDVVVESTAVGPPFTNYASEMNAGEGNAFYQTGLPPYAWGLPPSGMFESMVADGTIFQLQPYTANNALVLSPDTGLTSGTLTLATPATYAQIAVIAHSGNGTNITGALTLNFQDGSTYVTNYIAPDWFGKTNNVAWFAFARINLTSGADQGGTQNPRFYQTTINLAGALGPTNKPLASITFGKAQALSTAIYGVSGLLAAGATPIAATGWNRDLVIENTAVGPPYTNYASELNPGEGTAYYQNGLSGTTNGFPKSGAFSSLVDGTLFQFQPYTASNALVMSSDTGVSSGTLTFTTPALYNSLSILANSAASSGNPSLTLNFQDGSTFTTTYNAFDWFTNTNWALAGFERINLLTGALQGVPGNPKLFETTLDLVALLGATNKPLASITFNQAAGAGATAIYALSGIPGGQSNGIVTTPAIIDGVASGIQTRSATLNGTVLSTGGGPTEVLIYYGPTNGGTNAANWAQHVYVGVQNGSFAQSVTGLVPGATYYYNAVAVNAAGTAWATNPQSFTAASAALAGVTNLPATQVMTNAALLSGQVLSTGNDAPSVTLYYGPSNGGANPAAWAHSINLGTQVGLFAQSIAGLSPNTTYYFSAQASNGAGAAWASPSQSFTTPLTNPVPPSLVSVLTFRNDNTRTAQNTNEALLTLANVNTNSFGKLFSAAIDGYSIGQPLVLPNVNIPGKGVHNVVYVTTEHDSVYAWDADSNAGQNGVPLWQVSFINPSAGISTVSATGDLASIAGGFVGPELGITGTPVIDPVSGTLYVVAITKEIVGGVTNFYNRLHALDVTTGAEKFGGPVLIQGSVPGLGDGNVNGVVSFVQLKHHQRNSLAFNNGTVYIAFSGHFDYPPYHGWVFAYNGYTLAQTGIWNANPNGAGGGFWQAGCGPAIDSAGNLYLESGNGNFDAAHGVFGDSLIKLSSTNGLALADYFTPHDQLAMNLADLDLGSAGENLLPDSVGSATHPHLLVGTGKNGTLYLIDRDNLGQYNTGPSDSQIVQAFTGAVGGMWSTPAFFNGVLYCGGSGDKIKGFAIANAAINTTPITTTPSSYGGESPSISANGTSNAILWMINSSVLHAFNATNLSQELYNSSQNSARDNPGTSVKWEVPTIANGKVYLNMQGSLAVFGSGIFLTPPVISPNGGTFTNSVMVTISNTVPGASIYYTLDGSAPTTNSILYTGPFVLTANAGVQAMATEPGAPIGAVALATFYNSASLGNGVGLLGEYFRNTLYTAPFQGSPLVRTDATINFNWNSVSPDPSIPTTDYTVRWTGLLQPVFNETYTFFTTTDDGVRLWVNGQLLIDHWVPQSPTTWGGSISLQAGQMYTVDMEYFQQGGGAEAYLYWSSPSTATTNIPQSQLYPLSALPSTLAASGTSTNGGFSLRVSGLQGKNYILQGSTDLVNWTSLSTNAAPSNLFILTDLGSTNYPKRFYRAIQQP